MNRLFYFPAAMLMAVTSASAAVAQFDINDFATASPTLAGWTAVTGAADNADTLTGTDGTHTLTLTTSGDGQDRDRNVASFPADARPSRQHDHLAGENEWLGCAHAHRSRSDRWFHGRTERVCHGDQRVF